jgi:hypothetical protein
VASLNRARTAQRSLCNLIGRLSFGIALPAHVETGSGVARWRGFRRGLSFGLQGALVDDGRPYAPIELAHLVAGARLLKSVSASERGSVPVA